RRRRQRPARPEASAARRPERRALGAPERPRARSRRRAARARSAGLPSSAPKGPASPRRPRAWVLPRCASRRRRWTRETPPSHGLPRVRAVDEPPDAARIGVLELLGQRALREVLIANGPCETENRGGPDGGLPRVGRRRVRAAVLHRV